MASRRIIAAFATTVCLSAGAVSAQITDNVIKIGLLDDFSGVYSGDAGVGSAEAVKLAIEEMGGSINGKKIEYVQADHQNKPDVGIQIAKKWFENEQVDVILGLTNSTVAMAVQEVARDAKKLAIYTGAGADALTGKTCSPYGIRWTYSTYAYTKGSSSLIPELGDTFYFITADYSFGHLLENEMTSFIEASGRKVLGSAKAPLGTSDFSSFILQAKGSGADAIILASAGNDLNNVLKQLKEFGVTDSSTKILPLIMDLRVIDAVGKDVAGGLTYIAPWYAELNDATKKLDQNLGGRIGHTPGPLQAGSYSGALNYLKAVEKSGTDDALTVARTIRESAPINDGFATNGTLRPDGTFVHDMYLLKVKTTKESKNDKDRVSLVSVVKGDDAFRKAGETGCNLK